MKYILYNEGAQTVRHVPVDHLGRPVRVSSPTYTIVDLRKAKTDSDRTIQASTSATIGSETETTAADAGPSEADAKLITVSDASDFTEGHTYLIEAATGERETFTLWRKTSTLLYSRDPLMENYPSGSTVRAVELEGTFPSAEANDEEELEDGAGPYQVTWEYTINGQKYLAPEQIFLARYSVQPFINETDVFLAYPTLAQRVDRQFSVHSAISAAMMDFVGELQAANKDPTLYRGSVSARLALRTKAIEYCLRWMTATDRSLEEADRYEERYRHLMDTMLQGKPPHGTVEVRRNLHTATPDPDSGLTGNDLIRRK